MCLLMFLGGLALLLLVLFVKSALILLPWTITAMVLGALGGMGLGVLLGRSRASGAMIGVASALGLTIAFGYLGYWGIPPTAPPPRTGLQALLETPEPSQQNLWEMFPIHLGISALIGALIVSRVWYRWSPDLVRWQQGGVRVIPLPAPDQPAP